MNLYYEKGREIVKKLLDLDYQAFFVGGFVRDYLLGIEPSDVDITTNALPKEIQKIFAKTKATGIKYGTISVYEDDFNYEVTTFRADMNYIDHRRPERVVFSEEIEEDLKRRDFTINALAMNYYGEITDLFSGKSDLEQKLIRAIGDPDLRFKEDALRILRAFRFVSKLDFDIESKTLDSINKNIHLLSKISNERILGEFKKIIDYPHHKKALAMLYESKVSEVFPELEAGLRLLNSLKKFEINYLEFFALCLYCANLDIPTTWRFSNKEKAYINKIVELVQVTENDTYNEMIIYRLGKDIPLMANKVSCLINPENNQEDLINDIYESLPIYKTCDLKFKGQDILELTTLKNAEIIGEIIDDITYQIITNNLENKYEDIKQYTLNLMESKYGKK
ncbi:CCA tRNA nucleotidyltransferase [Mycoplasmatota bacterium WC30]